MLSPRRDIQCLWLLVNKTFYLIKIVLHWICRYLASNIYNHGIAGIFSPLHSKSELSFLINMIKIKGHILIIILVILCKLNRLEFILGQIISKLELDCLWWFSWPLNSHPAMSWPASFLIIVLQKIIQNGIVCLFFRNIDILKNIVSVYIQ